MKFSEFHRYNTLVRRGLTKPLACSYCENEYTLRSTDDGEPVLQCHYCASMVQPGLAMYDRVRAVVREHFV